jgi:hypothetical protein
MLLLESTQVKDLSGSTQKIQLESVVASFHIPRKTDNITAGAALVSPKTALL